MGLDYYFGKVFFELLSLILKLWTPDSFHTYLPIRGDYEYSLINPLYKDVNYHKPNKGRKIREVNIWILKLSHVHLRADNSLLCYFFSIILPIATYTVNTAL